MFHAINVIVMSRTKPRFESNVILDSFQRCMLWKINKNTAEKHIIIISIYGFSSSFLGIFIHYWRPFRPRLNYCISTKLSQIVCLINVHILTCHHDKCGYRLWKVLLLMRFLEFKVLYLYQTFTNCVLRQNCRAEK